MGVTLVMSDGGVGGLIATAAAGLRAATGPTGSLAMVYPCGPTDLHRNAAVGQAGEFGLSAWTEQAPIGEGVEGWWIRTLVEAAVQVRRMGGGEVVWPVSYGGDEPDVGRGAAALSATVLVSQLASLETSARVSVRAPYADLTDRQLADLVLDMDLPIWTCWWMAAAKSGEGKIREQGQGELDKWKGILKQAGWAGSIEAKAQVVVRAVGKINAGGKP